MDSRKRKQDELMAIERSRQKFDLKRRILQHKEQIKNSTEQKKDLAIPKKNSQENNVSNLPKQNFVDKKKMSNSKLEVKRSTDTQNVNKINSTKQSNFSKVSITKGTPSLPAQNFTSLLEQAKKNDSSAVEQLYNELESSSKSNKKVILQQPKKLLPVDGLGITAGLNLSHSAAREKQKELKQKSKIEAQMAERVALNSQKSVKPNKTINTKMPSNNQKLIISQFSTTKNYSQPSTDSSHKKLSSLPTNGRENQELTRINGPPINKTITKNKTNKVRISLPSKTMVNKTTNNLSINAHPDSCNSQNPQKRYLPGDVRYQGPTQNKKISFQQKPVIPSVRKSVSIPSKEKIEQKNENSKILPSNNVNKKTNNASFVLKQQLNTNTKNQLIEKKQNQIKVSSPFDKRKEISSNKNNERIHKNIVDTRGQQMLKRPLKTDGVSLARIKQDSFNRNQMLQNMRKANSTNSSNKAMRYANYSETDDDEDDDDEGGGYGDEYDSDLADFIDDSMVDDLQREDLEETLRLINPRYDKKKWMIRERMIDDRRMDARFKEVELEERRSAKYGLVEDLIEAKRGSKALA
uniref:Protein SPT2 homolog n=1 Tax=Meloidogyne incognita TaxID=6306 RepID=A0A914LW44_MELIC